MKNYRPISILPVVSKIIENVMHTQLTDYFTLNKLFTSQQYGYRENRSTELAALELMDRNLDDMNRNLTPVNVYIDLSKAFDCLDHNILLTKLKFYGLNDNAINPCSAAPGLPRRTQRRLPGIPGSKKKKIYIYFFFQND